MNTEPPEDEKSTVEGDSPPTASTAATPDLPGYLVLELVGRGGMGKVYRALHLELNRVVAIKLLAHEPDEKLLARFRDEARAVARLRHPNIAQLYETGTADGRPYFAQEFVDGGTLARKFAGQPQDPQFVARVVETVARAVQHSHEHGILHRDLKPGNVLLAADGSPKVTDFGLAKEIPPTPTDRSTVTHDGGLTRTGEILGTPGYMPPEQASGITSTLGPAADVYSLGAILYEGLTGRPPFQAPDALQTLLMVLSMEPVPPRTLLPRLPRDLDTICLKCLEKSPKKRYPSAGALADDLRRFLAGEPIVARPVSVTERVAKWARRKKAQAAVVVLSALFVAAVIGSAVWLYASNAELTRLNADLTAAKADLETVNADLEKSRAETEGMLGYALATMDEYHFTLSDKLATLPKGEKLRIEVLEQARKTLDELYAANPRREKVWEHLAGGYERLASALATAGNPTGAEQAYRRAWEAADRLATTHPDRLDYRVQRGVAAQHLAYALEKVGRTGDAVPLHAEAEKEAAALEAAHPNDPGVIWLNVLAYSRRALTVTQSGSPAEQEQMHRRWADLTRRLADARPDEPKLRLDNLDWNLKLVSSLVPQAKFAEAEQVLAGAKRTLDALPDPDSLAARKVRGTYHTAVASYHYWRDQPDEADAAYRRALAVYEGLVNDFPDSPNLRRSVVSVWFGIGSVWTFGGKPSKGLEAYEKARELAAALVRDYPDDVDMKKLLAGVEQSIHDQKTNPVPDKQ